MKKKIIQTGLLLIISATTVSTYGCGASNVTFEANKLKFGASKVEVAPSDTSKSATEANKTEVAGASKSATGDNKTEVASGGSSKVDACNSLIASTQRAEVASKSLDSKVNSLIKEGKITELSPTFSNLSVEMNAVSKNLYALQTNDEKLKTLSTRFGNMYQQMGTLTGEMATDLQKNDSTAYDKRAKDFSNVITQETELVNEVNSYCGTGKSDSETIKASVKSDSKTSKVQECKSLEGTLQKGTAYSDVFDAKSKAANKNGTVNIDEFASATLGFSSDLNKMAQNIKAIEINDEQLKSISEKYVDAYKGMSKTMENLYNALKSEGGSAINKYTTELNANAAKENSTNSEFISYCNK
jgi:phosphopantetheine adenylyltransferase